MSVLAMTQIKHFYNFAAAVKDAAVGSPEYLRNLGDPMAGLFAANDINWRNAA
jgi:hypothetical protein